MFLDATLSFNSSLNTPQVVAATANSANTIDVTGAGVGNAPTVYGGILTGNTADAVDYGLGDGMATPWLIISVPATGTGSGTMSVALQAAPDNGTYGAGTWTTIATSNAYVGTALTAGTLIELPFPPVQIGTPWPRFYRLVYTVTGTFSAGILASIAINPPSSLAIRQVPSNYAVA